MAGTVWDSMSSLEQGTSVGIDNYQNLSALFKQMPYDVSTPEKRDVSTRLKNAIGSGAFGSVNGQFTGELDRQLANPATRDRLIELMQKNPSGVDAAMSQMINHPETTASLINSIPLPQAAPAAAPAAVQIAAATLPAHSHKKHFNESASAEGAAPAPGTPAAAAPAATVAQNDASPPALPPQIAGQVQAHEEDHPPGAAEGGFNLGGLLKDGKLAEMFQGFQNSSFGQSSFGKILCSIVGSVLGMFGVKLDNLSNSVQQTDANGQPSTSVVSGNGPSLAAENKGLQANGGALRNEQTGQTVALGQAGPAAAAPQRDGGFNYGTAAAPAM